MQCVQGESSRKTGKVQAPLSNLQGLCHVELLSLNNSTFPVFLLDSPCTWHGVSEALMIPWNPNIEISINIGMQGLCHVELLSLNNRLVLGRLPRQILAAHGTG
jgi:hypothetical protein